NPDKRASAPAAGPAGTDTLARGSAHLPPLLNTTPPIVAPRWRNETGKVAARDATPVPAPATTSHKKDRVDRIALVLCQLRSNLDLNRFPSEPLAVHHAVSGDFDPAPVSAGVLQKGDE